MTRSEPPLPADGWLRVRPASMLAFAAAAVVAASALALVGSAPARAGGATSAVVGSASGAGDVLFWSRGEDYGSASASNAIVKASAAAPLLTATVLAGSDSATFSEPEVSPDGSKLVYSKSNPSGNRSVEVRDLGTGRTTVLASEDDNAYSPAWSPDGASVAYVEHRDQYTGPANVRVVAAAGGPSRVVAAGASAPAWRPDGKLTVARTEGLWVTGATPDDAVFIPGSKDAHDHAWSPDGTQVAFSKWDNFPVSSIATLPAAGGTPTVLSNGTEITSVAWSGDGQRVYYTEGTSWAGGEISSWVMQVARTGGTATKFNDVGDHNHGVSVSTKAAAPVPSDAHDFTADGFADVIGRTSNGDLRVYTGNGLALSGSRRIGTGWGGMTAILTPGDFNGDGKPDVIGRLPNGDLRLYTGVGGGPAGSRLIGTSFGGMTAVFSPGDFTDDGRPDVIARTTSGDLRLYVGNGVRLTGGTVIGTSFGAMTALFSPGDFTGDGKPDVIGRTSNGELRLYNGTGTRLSGSSVIGTGWNGLSALFSPGDFNLDGKPDVTARMPNGDLRVYYGTGTGSRLSGYRPIGTGWNSVNPIL